jgi:NhaP-type Na+/H+ or K+/H+ antiporter
MITGIGIFFALIVIYTIVGYALGRISITMPMFFVIGGALIGAEGLGWVSSGLETSEVETLTEVTLALLLFADAATLKYGEVRDDAKLPMRLLVIAFPLVVLFGAISGFLLFPAEGIGFALLLAAILAPTDAALGLPIFNNARVPARVRRALNVESGLNDGLASPLVTLFIALALEQMGGTQGQHWVLNSVREIAIAVGIGIALGLAGGWLFAQAVNKNWTSNVARQIGNPALALLIFFATKQIGGNGFVAVFVAGILFAYITRNVLHEAIEFTEITGTFLSLFVWTIFGSAIVLPLFKEFNSLALLYAILSLTVVRMIAVAIALIGTHLRKDTLLMMGWLGPRGLASVVFLIMAYEAAHKAHVETNLLVSTVGWTILLSVLLHGASALPLANWYARRLENASSNIPEMDRAIESKTLRRRPFYAGLLDQFKTD